MLKSTNDTKQMPKEMSLGRSQSNEFPYFFSWDLAFIALLFSPCLPSFSLGTRVVFSMEECKVGGRECGNGR